ncbi:hypothetical protein ABPG74_016035 [Tetrahymena malaccensis]
MSIKVEVIRKKTEQRGPYLANFEQNIPPQEDFEQSIKVRVQEKNKKKAVLRMSNNILEIFGKGQNCSGQFNSDSNEAIINENDGAGESSNNANKCSSAYLIGIKDDKTNTIKLFQVEQLFKLQQHTLKELETSQNIDSNIAKTKTTHMEQKQMLVQEFGTVKSRKKVKQMQNNIVHEQNLSQNLKVSIQDKGEELEADAMNHTIRERDQEIDSKREFLPEFDLETKNPTEIYSLNSIISPEDQKTLSFAAEYIKKRDLIKSECKNMTHLVRNLLFDFQTHFGGRNNQSLIAKQLVYLDYLLRVANKVKLSGKTLDEVSKETNIPADLLKNILKNFYQAFQSGSGVFYQRSQALKDKLISYIIVLALMVFDYKFDAAPLASLLKIEPKRFLTYAKEAGCSVKIKENKDASSKNAHCIEIELKAPLKLIEPKKPTKKNK